MPTTASKSQPSPTRLTRPTRPTSNPRPSQRNQKQFDGVARLRLIATVVLSIHVINQIHITLTMCARVLQNRDLILLSNIAENDYCAFSIKSNKNCIIIIKQTNTYFHFGCDSCQVILVRRLLVPISLPCT